MDQTTPFIYPGDEGSKLKPSSRYENFIGGDWQKPKSGKYFVNFGSISSYLLSSIVQGFGSDLTQSYGS